MYLRGIRTEKKICKSTKAVYDPLKKEMCSVRSKGKAAFRVKRRKRTFF